MNRDERRERIWDMIFKVRNNREQVGEVRDYRWGIRAERAERGERRES